MASNGFKWPFRAIWSIWNLLEPNCAQPEIFAITHFYTHFYILMLFSTWLQMASNGFKWPFGTIWSHLEPFGAFVGAILRSQPETLAVYTFYTLFYTFHSNLIVVLQMASNGLKWPQMAAKLALDGFKWPFGAIWSIWSN